MTPTRKELNIEDRIKYKTAQAKSQKDSSFPVDGHQAIPNKTSKTNRKRTNDLE